MHSVTKSDSVFQAILDGITRHPRNFLCFVWVVVGLWFSLLTVVIALFLFGILRLITRLSGWWIIIVGSLWILLSWAVVGVNTIALHTVNTIWFHELLYQHQFAFNDPYDVLSALPYGVLLAGLLLWIQGFTPSLHRELQRIGRGKTPLSQKKIASRKIQQRLRCLTHAAYEQGTLLGVDQLTGQYAHLSDRDANLHTLVIGTTGSGKTTSLGNIVESAILRKLPLFCIDGKGDLDLAHRVRYFAEQHGRAFYLFSMMGESVKYNPIAFGGFTSKKDRIVELRDWSEDHYRKLAEGYLQTVFRILETTPVPIDLYTLSQYLTPKSLYALVRHEKNTTRIAEIETLEATYKDMQSLIAEIHNITHSEIGHLFDCSDGTVMTLSQALNENAIVYCCLQPLAFPAYAELLGKLIINDLKSLIAHQLQQRAQGPLYILFDEFSTFAGNQIIHLINQGRSAGVHAILSTQSLSDLLQKGGEAFLGQVLNNVNNYLIQRQNNPQDAERLANIIGTQDDFQLMSQISTATTGGIASGAVTPVKAFIVHPDHIKRLPLGEAIFVNKQHFQVQWVSLRKSTL